MDLVPVYSSDVTSSGGKILITPERQQMIEGNADASRTLEQLEKQHALDRDNPDSRIDDLDPTPPKSD